MALIKGNKPVNKNNSQINCKADNENQSSLVYLKKEKLSLFDYFSSYLHYLLSKIFEINMILLPIFFTGLGVAYWLGYIPLFSFFIYGAVIALSFLISRKIPAGRLSYILVDGFSWWETATLLSPQNPSPGVKVVGTQLVTSRFLIVPGPHSSYNGFARRVLPFLAFTSGIVLMPIWMLGGDYLEQGDKGLILSLAFIWIIAGSFVLFKYSNNPLGQPRRFFIFDRKKQTLSYHPSFFSRKMVTYSWLEFEGRAVAAYRHGYLSKLIHASTGNILELQGPDLHWNNAGAVEAYSYVARFMDLSQSLPDEVEFERYLPRDEDLSHIKDEEEKVRMMLKASWDRLDRRKKYHNPNADTVFSKMASFEQAIKEYPWLSAKNVWAAAHKYGKQPNWDKWVRDKWGIAANEDYEVAESDREGEPEWFPQFFEYLKTNKNKLKYMDDDARIMFFQDWFEETFPELHWVDPVTADCYEQEEVFS